MSNVFNITGKAKTDEERAEELIDELVTLARELLDLADELTGLFVDTPPNSA